VRIAFDHGQRGVNFRRFLELGVIDGNHRSRGGGRVGRHDRIPFDRHGQHKSVVVIGVFTDDIHAAGRGHDPARRASVMFFKFSGQVSREFF